MNSISSSSDAAISTLAADKYGFKYIAEGLAESILNVDDGEGMVIGIEGAWGSGKTSLMNLLEAIISEKGEKLITLKISPWASGSAGDIIPSLLIPVSDKISQIEINRMSQEESGRYKKRKKTTDTAKMILGYAKKTTPVVSALLKVADVFVPGSIIGRIGEAITVLFKSSNDAKGHTLDNDKQIIAKKIKSLNVRFIIMIDDLDRLEPSQAVEVIRMVKSVANFPNFTYLMCYDKKILAHAIKHGLVVENGMHYLQKIIQVSFSIPLPEAFDLRIELKDRVNILFSENNTHEMGEAEGKDLAKAIDVYGGLLSTPREVKLIANLLAFHYPHISKHVYFPDMCFLFILKLTWPELYDWVENYLRNISIIATRHGSVSSSEKKEIGAKLRELLPDDGAENANAIFSLHKYIPGLIHQAPDAESTVFNNERDGFSKNEYGSKRLGNPSYYRYYFAFAPAKNTLSEDKIEEFRNLAELDVNAFCQLMINYAESTSVFGRTWFEYIIDIMTEDFIEELSVKQAKSFLLFFFNYMDDVGRLLSKRIKDFSFRNINTSKTARVLFQHIKKQDGYFEESKQLILNGSAINWIVAVFIRDCMWAQGVVGDRPQMEEEWIFTKEELKDIIGALDHKLQSQEVKNNILNMNLPAAYLYGWREISGQDIVRRWAEEVGRNDEQFLRLLLAIRTTTYSSTVSYPLHEKNIALFFKLEDVLERLKPMDSPLAQLVKESIEIAESF